MRKILIISLLMLVVVIVIIMIMNKTPDFPANEINDSDAIDKLRQSETDIVLVGNAEDKEWYLTLFNKGEGQKNFIKEMENKGWTFETQEGSGFLFRKGEQELKASCVIWNKKYNVCHAPETNN
ncbi:hypothetical protein CVD25_11880 [Bacillus canaveralius]|uniref:Uncharacterized protein n=1 Tax=Bacillus canaveralius TaxID=1403243 RepID=A0A2N5GN92_9BACI|nr:hypothetical protein [Bacillus canaveralius]PLR83733.1 hypothetical protein CU635_08300 [Bacillus canaveralius]PLR96419.1 hypothetical protein CVD25_11880 [Bacillus canaveralius]RSK44889.1 hypothetical protein EJA13_20525 [Bacillus canaveralius]